jgi:hypothetical protein
MMVAVLVVVVVLSIVIVLKRLTIAYDWLELEALLEVGVQLRSLLT